MEVQISAHMKGWREYASEPLFSYDNFLKFSRPVRWGFFYGAVILCLDLASLRFIFTLFSRKEGCLIIDIYAMFSQKEGCTVIS